jgi:hypothetical protein
MSDQVRIDIAGDRQTGLRFEDFPDDLHDDLRSEIDSLSRELLSRIEAAVPSKGGTLRSQVRLRMFGQEDRIRGYIDIDGRKGSTDYAKAGALEYGSRGKPTKVGAHQMKLDHFWDHRLAAPTNVLVDAYSRTPNIAEHSFMRGPLAAMRPEIVQRLTGVVERAVADAND